MEKKRLKRNLPFGKNNFTEEGTVIRLSGGIFSISYGNTFYKDGGSSYNGLYIFDESETKILEKIWVDSDWFEDATLNHVDIVIQDDKITLEFDKIDAEDAENLAKATNHYFQFIMGKEKKAYAWDELAGFTTTLTRKAKEV